MRMTDQPRDVSNGVGRLVASAHVGPADVHRIGTMVDGFDADLGIARGRQQFQMVTGHGYRA